MKIDERLKTLSFLTAAALFLFLFAGSASAERSQPTTPDDNASMNSNLNAILNYGPVQNVLAEYSDPDFSKNRFKEHMEVVRISSPSRQEIYRGMEMAERFRAAGFNGVAGSDYYTVFDVSGRMDGAAIQLVDGRTVWNACAVVKGSTPDSIVDGVTIFSRPKVVIEGHIDTVNPSSIVIDNDTSRIPDYIYDKVRIAPASDNLVNSPEELDAIAETLNFDPGTGRIIEDAVFAKAYQRFDNLSDAKANGGYRIYIPGYSDAMNNTINVYQMAKLFRKHGIKPVHDVWFCATSGEEGRGNLAGMKQLYGYNQDYETTDNAQKGKNTLNIVANMSIDGGNLSIHYLGSYRYEVNYLSGSSKANAASAAAESVALISDLKSPSETDAAKPKTTYTVGIVYPVGGDGSVSTSFEIDMRSPVPETLLEMRDLILPLFAEGAKAENLSVGGNYVTQSVKWFGDRPAHRRNFDLMATDPLIYAGWKSYELTYGKTMNLPQYPNASTSLNDNIPAAMGIPSVNMNIGVTAAGGGGHAFNEWGIPGKIEKEAANFKRVMLTLLAVAGLNDTVTDPVNPTIIVPNAYPDLAPRHMNVNAADGSGRWN